MSALYMDVFAPVICIIIVTVMWFLHKKKKTKFIKRKPVSEQEKRTYEKWEKRIEITAVAGLIIAWILVVIPHILDVPYLVTGGLKIAMGTVTGGDTASEESEHDRSIRIEDEMSGHEISVDFYGAGIHKDEFVIVHYLPHTKIGYVVAKGQE